MKIALIGYQGSGKSTLFEWLSGIPADPSQSHTGQTAMAAVPDSRIESLAAIYHPKKVTLASLELLDTPGLARTHEGNAARLALLREAGCLVPVVAAFAGADAAAELRSFEEDLLLADMEIVSGRIERLRESLRKPRPTREQEQAELAALEPILTAIESGTPLRDFSFSEAQAKATRSFGLLTQKPKLLVINTADDQVDPAPWTRRFEPAQAVVAVPLRLELELASLPPAERAEFEREMGLKESQRDAVLRAMLAASGQMLFFTASDKEVRTWMLRQGGTALEAAAGIHTDLARGFIRAETMSCDDLIRLGSEREVKSAHLMRQEPKDYTVRDGDILHIRFSV